MKTQKNKLAVKKVSGNPFDKALIRLGHHVTPQQHMKDIAAFPALKKS